MIQANNVTLRLGKRALFEDVNIKFTEGNCYGLIGANGAGKSTLLKIITGEEPADTGIVTLAKDKTLGYLAQQQDLQSDRSIYDELLSVKQYILDMESELRRIEAAMNSASGDELDALMNRYTNLNHEFEMNNGYAYKSEITGVLKGLGFAEEDFSLHVNTLSGGQKTRVSLGKLLLSKPDIIMLDEPTNHLDMESITALNEALKDFTGALLFTSQDHHFVQTTANRIMEITTNGLIDKECTYDEYLENDEAARKRQIVEIEEDDE